jgi:hypothetical protein
VTEPLSEALSFVCEEVLAKTGAIYTAPPHTVVLTPPELTVTFVEKQGCYQLEINEILFGNAGAVWAGQHLRQIGSRRDLSNFGRRFLHLRNGRWLAREIWLGSSQIYGFRDKWTPRDFRNEGPFPMVMRLVDETSVKSGAPLPSFRNLDAIGEVGVNGFSPCFTTQAPRCPL